MTRLTASGRPSGSTFRKVSYCPAKEASSRSSAVPEERTAKRWAPSAAADSNICGVASRRCPSAAVVTTNPGGTGNPAEARRPRLAAFAPRRNWSRIAASDKATTSGLRIRATSISSALMVTSWVSGAALRSASPPVEPYGDELTRMGPALLVPLGIGQVAAGEEEDDQRRDEHRRRRLERQILPELSGLDAVCEVAGE